MTTHREALEAVLISGADHLLPCDAAIMQLARMLADQCDEAGPDGPGTRLVGTYLATLRSLAPAVGRSPLARPSKLAELRAEAHRQRMGAR